MAKIGVLRTIEGDQLMFYCAGCKSHHAVKVRPAPSPSWDWNGSYDKPTFRPSILVTGVARIDDENGDWTGEWRRDEAGKAIQLVCHSFVTDGNIQFLPDCTHEFAGQTIPLE